MGTSGLFFQFMSAPEDVLPVIRRCFQHFEHESLRHGFFAARCAQATHDPATVFKMPPAQ
jgi:hypothetical protein